MDAIAESFPEQTAVDARPSIIVPEPFRGEPPRNISVAVIRGNDSGTLRLIGYRGDLNKLIRVAQSAPTGRIKGTPAVCLFGKRGLVTASHGENSNRLFLIYWRVRNDGQNSIRFERIGDSGALIGTPGGSSDLVEVDGNRVAVAVITKDGDLKVISLDISSSGVFDRVSDSGNAAGKITSPPTITWVPIPRDIASSTGISTGWVVTAFRSSKGRLKLISWLVEGGRVRRLSDTGNGGIAMDGRPAICSGIDFNSGSILVGVATHHDDHYHFSAWGLGQGGRFFGETSVRSEFSASGSPAITIRKGPGNTQFAVATRTEPGGGLRVEIWDVVRIPGGLEVGRVETGFVSNIGGVGSPSICFELHPPWDSEGVYTAIRNRDHRLAVHKWI